jgi:predicted Zn-dependent peptidase
MKHYVDEVTLKNGSKGLLIHVPDASVMTFDISFRAGDYLTEKDKYETAHLMEHILLGANELYPKSRDFQFEMEKNGAYANASTGSYDITYEAECADFEWDRILNLLFVAISKPLFLKEEFDSEFGNVKEELYSRSNNHFRHLYLSLKKKYGFCSLTDQERIKLMDNVGVGDVQGHYKKTHKTPNMRFVVAGNLTKSRKESIEKLINNVDIPNEGHRKSLPDETPKTLDGVHYIENKSIENLYFYIDTFTRRRITDAESYAFSLANIMFTETLHSRIYGKAREKGLVYSVTSGSARLLGSTNFWLGAQVMPNNLKPLFDIICNEITQIKNGKFNEDELKAAKLFALGRYHRSAQTVSSIAGIYSNRYFYEEEVENFESIPEKIQSVNKQQIEAVISALFKEKIGGLGVLGNCGEEYAKQAYEPIANLWQ